MSEGPQTGLPRGGGDQEHVAEPLYIEEHNGIGVIYLNRPSRLNALRLSDVFRLTAEVRALHENPAIGAVVLTGIGRGFCVGADLGPVAELFERGERPDYNQTLLDGYRPLVTALAQGPKAVVAAVNGATVGAGLGLALACDLRVASTTSSFLAGFGGVGLAPDAGFSYFLPRVVGFSAALRMSLLGERYDATRALALGLVHATTAPEDLQRTALEWAGRLAELPIRAQRETRRLLEESLTMTMEEAIRNEARTAEILGQTSEHISAVHDFIRSRDAARR